MEADLQGRELEPGGLEAPDDPVRHGALLVRAAGDRQVPVAGEAEPIVPATITATSTDPIPREIRMAGSWSRAREGSGVGGLKIA